MFDRVSLNLTGKISKTEENFFKNAPKIDEIENSKGSSFQDVMLNMVNEMNNQLQAPDAMLKEVVAATGKYDIHDVMIALSKADIGVNIATTAATKVLQTYEKIMQIQL